MLVDDSAGATVSQFGDALIEIEANGHFFGSASLTVCFMGLTASRAERPAPMPLKTLAAHDGVFIEESYNLLNAWLGIVPGNDAHNLRRLALLETNCADLSFVFAQDCGEPDLPPSWRPGSGCVRNTTTDAVLLQSSRRRCRSRGGAWGRLAAARAFCSTS